MWEKVGVGVRFLLADGTWVDGGGVMPAVASSTRWNWICATAGPVASEIEACVGRGVVGAELLGSGRRYATLSCESIAMRVAADCLVRSAS